MPKMKKTFQAEAANEKEFLLNRLHQLLDQERIQVALASIVNGIFLLFDAFSPCLPAPIFRWAWTLRLEELN